MYGIETRTVSVTLDVDISLKQTPSGWWEAWHGKYGSTSAPTKEECIRIIKQRVLES